MGLLLILLLGRLIAAVIVAALLALMGAVETAKLLVLSGLLFTVGFSFARLTGIVFARMLSVRVVRIGLSCMPGT